MVYLPYQPTKYLMEQMFCSYKWLSLQSASNALCKGASAAVFLTKEALISTVKSSAIQICTPCRNPRGFLTCYQINRMSKSWSNIDNTQGIIIGTFVQILLQVGSIDSVKSTCLLIKILIKRKSEILPNASFLKCHIFCSSDFRVWNPSSTNPICF